MRHVGVGLAALAMFCGVHVGAGARAQDADYPTRPIRGVGPYPAGGLVDLITRIVTERLGASLGQPFVVGSRGGANGPIATATVAHADPDGHTLLKIPRRHGL